MSRERISLALVVLAVAGILTWLSYEPVRAKDSSEKKQAEKKEEDPAVERTRENVKMLDEVYKTAIVLITDKYVHDESDFPAGSAAVAWFNKVSKSGRQDVRLMDVSGEPYNPANVAEDKFEKKAVEQLRAGEDYYEKVVHKDGKRYLRAVTAVPVVMKKCIMCHPNYEDAKPGEAIGAISYTLPVK